MSASSQARRKWREISVFPESLKPTVTHKKEELNYEDVGRYVERGASQDKHH